MTAKIDAAYIFTLVMAAIALIIVVAVVYLYIRCMPVPGELVNIVLVILGFFFGGKASSVTGNGNNAPPKPT